MKSNYKKGSDEYLVEMTDSTISELVHEKKDLYKAYNYYHGVRDKYQYEHLEKNYNIGNPTSIQFVPLIRKHVDAIIGEFLTTEIRPKISCKDKKTLTNILRDKQLEIASKIKGWVSSYLENSIYSSLMGQPQRDQKITDQVIDQEVADIKDQVNREFISNYEIAGQNIVQYIMQSRKMDFKNKIQQLLSDILISGESYYKVLPTSKKTNFKIEVEDPLNTFVSRNVKSRYIKDGYKSVVRHWMTREEIIIKYGNDLSKDDIESLDNIPHQNYNSGDLMLITAMNSRCGGFISKGILANTEVTNAYNYDYNGYLDLIPVYEVEWIDYDKKDGEIIGKRYSTVRIGDEIYILYGEDDTIRDVDSPNEVTLSINGMFYTDRTGAPYSLMLATADLQD